MCGIVGYVGTGEAAPVLIDGLYRLEYRGYDSAGISVLHDGVIETVKRAGRVSEIEAGRHLKGRVGIGHTRWATHGGPSERNAHPHQYGKIALVHNGIIENAASLRTECEEAGERFSSDTDSEVIAHLIDKAYRGDLLEAVKKGCERLEGSYALAVICSEEPSEEVCVRVRSPLIVGKRGEELYVSSDLPAIASEGMQAYALGDGEFALLKEGDIFFYNAALSSIEKKPISFTPKKESADLEGYQHFMRKEIDEIPASIRFSVQHIEDKGEYSDFYKVLCQTKYLHIVACGTAYHSGLCAKNAIERFCRIPVEVSVASEFRYRDPIIGKDTLLLAVSQSGETADTIACALLARERGAHVCAITNVAYSTITGCADTVLYTHAGREVAVAATKSFNAQLMTLYSILAALMRIHKKGEFSLSEYASLAEETLLRSACVRSWIPHFAGAGSCYFIGRGADYPIALEGSLKLKEITYLPSEGYPSGELKHGSLALIEKHTPVVAIITERKDKAMNAVHEAYARGARIFLITCFEDLCTMPEVTASVLIPKCALTPVLSVIPLQLLAYYTSVARGIDPDKPRNLAKSVTVE